MIEKIIHKKKLFALIIKGNFKKKGGITFFTPRNLPQQLGYMRRPIGHIIKPHKHKKKNFKKFTYYRSNIYFKR